MLGLELSPEFNKVVPSTSRLRVGPLRGGYARKPKPTGMDYIIVTGDGCLSWKWVPGKRITLVTPTACFF